MKRDKKRKSWVKNLFFNKKKVNKMKSKKFKLQKDKIPIRKLIFSKNMITSMLMIGLLSFTLVKTANITATFEISDLAQTGIETSVDDEYSNEAETKNTSVAFEIKDIFETYEKEAAEKKAAALEQQINEEQVIASTNAANYTSYPTESRAGWRNKIDVNGTVLNWNYNINGAAPSTGCSIWNGNGSTTDNQGAWFVGHNPGDFTCAYNLNYGDPITVYDEFGNSKTYHVFDMFEISDNSKYYAVYKEDTGEFVKNTLEETPEGEDFLPRIYPGGETVALQTCTGLNTGRIRLTIAR